MKLHTKISDDEFASPQTTIHHCIKTRNLDMLTQLLKNGDVDVHQPDWNGSGNAPVLDAAIEGETDMVRVLCENGCDINTRSLRGETALHMAVSCRQFDTEMINLLLSSGCNADIQDNLGRQTALQMFIKKHIAFGEMNESALEVFETLAKATNVNIADRRLKTPLHGIALYAKANSKLLQILLNCKADPNFQNDRGETPLHEALEYNNLTMAEFLIPATDLYLETKYKETPLHVAARKNMIEIVPLLLKNGSPINAQDLYGNTALHLAASKGYKEIVRFLVENDKIQLNIYNKEGLTPLHLAVESGFIYAVQILLKADSCDLTARTKRCETALDLAQYDYRRRSQPEMTEVLFRELQRRSSGKSM